MEKMLTCQSIGQLVVSAVSAIASIYTCSHILGFTLPAMVLAGIMTWILMKIGTFGITLLFQLIFYKGDYTQMAKDADDAMAIFKGQVSSAPKVIAPKVIKILKTDEKMLGTFQDVPFYDWIEILGKDGHAHRFNYFGAMDLTHGMKPIPEDCILIPPGLIYQVAPVINTVA